MTATTTNAAEILARLQRAEDLHRQALVDRGVPPHLIEGLVRYFVHRIRPGSFLVAILASDLRTAMEKADPESRRGLNALFLFLWQIPPSNSWGSYDALESWLAREDEPRHPDAHLGARREHEIGGDR